MDKYFSFLNHLQLSPVIRTTLSRTCLNKNKLGQYLSINFPYFWQCFKFPGMMGFCAQCCDLTFLDFVMVWAFLPSSLALYFSAFLVIVISTLRADVLAMNEYICIYSVSG